MSFVTRQLGPALDIDARLTEIERSVDLLLNVTPVNAAEAWADFERSDFATGPTLRLRPLEFEPDLVRRDLYNLEIENVTDPALHTLFRAKRDEIARQITALEDRDTSRFVYGSLQLYGGIAAVPRGRRGGAARDHPSPSSQHEQRHGRGVRGRGSCGDRSIPSRVSGLPGRTSTCATTSPS